MAGARKIVCLPFWVDLFFEHDEALTGMVYIWYLGKVHIKESLTPTTTWYELMRKDYRFKNNSPGCTLGKSDMFSLK